MIEPLYRAADDRYECGMCYRRSGRSGIVLPEISLGMWHNFGEINPLDRSKAMMRYAFDHGITSFDLANNYGPGYGTAEETFGYVFNKSFRPYRDEMFISSKAGYDMWPGPYGNWGSRKYLMASLDQSLRRMGLDYVDIFYSHRFDPETPLDETLQALVDIVRQGKALYAGISRWPLDAARYGFDYLRRHDTPCLLFQDRYNIIDRDVINSGVLAETAESGSGFIAFSPLAQGMLTSRYLDGVPEGSRASVGKFLRREQFTPEVVASLRSLDEIARGRGQTLAEMALSWVLDDKRVTSVIVGCSSVEQLDDSIGAMRRTPFTSDELAAIDIYARKIMASPL
ncbi:MAG: aldo/keto reductase [Bacteroidales bacterium]|nr:aldo/keto reductase [Bacteroidales bacterium]